MREGVNKVVQREKEDKVATHRLTLVSFKMVKLTMDFQSGFVRLVFT